MKEKQPSSSQRLCRQCGANVPENTVICPRCGKKWYLDTIEERGVNLWQKIMEKRAAAGLGDMPKSQDQFQQRRCPNCMAVLQTPVNICPYCGKNTTKAKIIPPDQAAAAAEAETASALNLPESARGLAKIKGAAQRARKIPARRQLNNFHITIVVVIIIVILAGIGGAAAWQMGAIKWPLNLSGGKGAAQQAPPKPLISNVSVASMNMKDATITWSLNPAAYGAVLYGKTESYGMKQSTDNSSTAQQTILSNLEPASTYHFIVLATDVDGKELSRGQDSIFTTLSENNTVVPLVSLFKVIPSDVGALIQWATDKPATSQVMYGTVETCDNSTSVDSRLVTTHSVKVSGLQNNTTYYYRIKSMDADGNANVMDSPNVFMTLVSLPTGSKIGNRAPDFTLPVFKSEETLSLRDFKDQKILLTFWAVYCPQCDRELEMLQSLKNRNPNGVAILAIFLESRLDDIDKTISQYKADHGDLTVPVLVDMYKTIGHMYNIDKAPCTIFIDGDGIIREIDYGSFNIDQIEQTLDNL